MSKHRLRFSKIGRSVYISHLDLMSTFQRAFMRMGVTVKHTEGYNPHAFVSIALPLSLGHASRCELLDFELLGTGLEQLPDLLNSCLPEGIIVHEAYENGRKIKELTRLCVQIIMTYDAGVRDEQIDKIRALFENPELIVDKKTKKGMAETDIIPMIKSFEIDCVDENKAIIETVICAQNPSLNPSYIVAAIERHLPECAPDFAEYERIETLDDFGMVFR